MTEHRKLPLYIDGDWREGSGGDTLDVINPATEEKIADLCMANEADIDDALGAVARGFESWNSLSGNQRKAMLHRVADLMRERSDEMGAALSEEQGKTVGEGKWEVNATADYFDDLAELILRIPARVVDSGINGLERQVTQQPIGPVFGIAPWNLPAMMPGRKIANSLAAGCSIIVKPAKETPATALAIARCCADAGIPAGVVNVVSGPSSLLSEKLISSPIIRKISFTGSTETGKKLSAMAGAHMKKVAMELGGHAPVIICEDVDIEQVAQKVVSARFANAGQSCMAATRFFVHRNVHDRFVDLFGRLASGLKVGNGQERDVNMGALASRSRVQAMEELVSDALGKGAKLVCGGSRIGDRGFFFEPTAFGDLPDDANILTAEPFGPISPILPFDDDEAVVRRANETPFGLAAYIFTRNIDRARKLAAGVDSGLVGINSMAVAGPGVPFGGVRDSGIGREGAIEGLLESMSTKTLSFGFEG